MKRSEYYLLAHSDTFGPTAKRVSIALIITVSIVVASILASFGLAHGAKRVSQLRLDRDPLAGCVLAGNEIRTKQQIPAAEMESIQTQLKQSCPETTVDVFGFRSMAMVFRADDGLFLLREGRTYQVDHDTVVDPVAKRLLASEPDFHSFGKEYFCPADSSQLHGEVPPVTDGIVVTKRLLTQLGVEEASKELVVRVSQIAMRIPVIRVVDHLPYNWSFLIPESYQERLVALERVGNRPMSSMTTSTVPDELVELVSSVLDKGDSLDKLSDAALEQGIDISAAHLNFDDQSKTLTISSLTLTYPEWSQLMTEWASLLEIEESKQGFTEIASPEIEEIEGLDYDVVTILAGDYGVLETLADRAETIELFQGFVDNESAKKVKAADKQTKLALQIVGLFSIVLGVVAYLCIRAILALNAEKRMREIGVLRVMGFNDKEVRLILRWQAVMIAGPSLAIGLIGGILLGAAFSYYQYSGNSIERVLGFHAPWRVVGWSFFLAFLACLISATWVAKKWEEKDACELLNS